MEKFWKYLRLLSPFRLIIPLSNLFQRFFAWIYAGFGKLMLYLAPVGRFLMIYLRPIGRFFMFFLRPLGRFLLLIGRPLGRALMFFVRLTRLNKILNWPDLILVARPYWLGDSRNKACSLLSATLLCMVANAKAAFYFGAQLKLINDIVNTVGSNDPEFFLAVAWLAGIGAIWALVNIGYGTFRTYLAIDWRFWLSSMYIRNYVKNEAYIRLKIDNPDQRQAQDPDVFANTTVWLFMVLVETGVNLWTFLPVLYDASWYLTLACFGCAAASYVSVLWMGRALPTLTFQQYDSEATLRTYLGDGPRYGASIALQRSEPLFLAQATKRLATVRSVLTRIMFVNTWIGIYNFFADKVVSNAALVGIGWLVMHGKATMGSIAQASQAFTNVYGGLTVFTSQYGAYSTLKAEIERLGPFARALDDIGQNRMPAGQWVEYVPTDSNVISFDKVTIVSSYLDPKPVVKEMTLAFDVDTLVTGRDGHGKTDLAKAIGYGAAVGAGKITRPVRDKIMFLTQAPYFSVCTLREYLRDMQPSGPEDDDRLTTVLNLVGLQDVLEQSKGETTGILDTPQDWKIKISTLQQQQLCLARAILFKPAVLVIDQATDGMEPELEEDLYKVLRGLGIRLITFSNSGRLAKSFKRVVELREDRGFDQHDAQEYKVPGWKILLRRLGGNKPEGSKPEGKKPE